MKFKKSDLIEMIGDESDILSLVEEEFIESTRWHNLYRYVFSFEGKLYETSTRLPATEEQPHAPFECEPNEIECKEVFKKEITKIIYE